MKCTCIHAYACVCICVCVCVCGWVDGWVGGWVGECVCIHTHIKIYLSYAHRPLRVRHCDRHGLQTVSWGLQTVCWGLQTVSWALWRSVPGAVMPTRASGSAGEFVGWRNSRLRVAYERALT